MKKDQIYADVIADFLVEHNIPYVFNLTGGMIAFMEDSIGRTDKIKCVPMHHEQAAGFAAEGFARKSGNFGVAMATSGPGATNLITAIGSCFFDSVPALFLTGQVHSNNLKKKNEVRQEGFQETNIVDLVKSITKYAVQIKNPEDIIHELHKAHKIMKEGRPGPVLIDIPINFQRSKNISPKPIIRNAIAKNPKPNFSNKVSKLQELLQASKAPLILVGHGVRLAGAQNEFLSFQKNNNLPVVASLMGLDVFPSGKDFVGYIGTNGNRDSNIIFANADLIIVLGSRLDLRQTGDPALFNPNTKIVHIDVDENVIDYGIKSDLSFVCDINFFLSAVQSIQTPNKPAWKKFIQEIKKNFSRLETNVSKINPNLFLEQLSVVSQKNTTVVVDVGQNQQWCAQSWKVKRGQRLLFSGGMGAMGFALPAAIGAWYADTASKTIVVTGDGGLQINIQELETISRNQIPVKIFVLNNNSLGMVREFQDTYLNKNNYTTVSGYGNPNFKKLAEAYNIRYSLISKSTDVQKLSEILDSDSPVFIEVIIDINAPLQPKIVYGRAIDDQAPYLSEEKKMILSKLKKTLHS